LIRRATRSDLAAILILVLIAACFRFYRLNELPIGLWRDEAANGLEALRVLQGHLAVFYGTQEPLFIYFVAISIALLGRNPLAIRIVAAVAGTATIPVTYLLVKELLRSSHQRARTVAFLTSLWLATSYWHLNFSRLGFRGVLLPLFAAISFYFLWRGWNQLDDHRSQRSTYVCMALAGACFGITFYTYTPGRFLPLLLIPFLIQAARRTGRTTCADDSTRRALPLNVPALRALLVFVLSFAVILVPLTQHFLADPKSLWVRFGVSVFGAETGEPLPVLLAGNVLRQLSMFGFLADPNTRHNPAGRPAFDLITLGFFVPGFLLSLRRSRKMPNLFCVLWFLTMQMPAILTYPELPHSLRAIGALPIAYVFPALGLEASWEWLRARAPSLKARWGLAVALGLCLMLSAGLCFRDYFAPQVAEIELVKAFDPRFVEIASAMNNFDDSGAVWLFPIGPHDEQRMAYFVVDFLYQGRAPYHYLRLDENTLASDLTEACQGAQRALLLQRTEDGLAQPWHEPYADTRGLLTFLLSKHGEKVGALQFNSFAVLLYEIPDKATFSFPSEFQSLNVVLDQGLRVTGVAFGFGGEASTNAWAALQCQAEGNLDLDYALQVAVTGEDGQPAARADKLLLSTEFQPTSTWAAGQQEREYYVLEGLPRATGDGYSLEVSVYPTDVDGGLATPLAAGGDKRTIVVGIILPSGELLIEESAAGSKGTQ
jgi:hypothetical protein